MIILYYIIILRIILTFVSTVIYTKKNSNLIKSLKNLF